MKALIEKLEAAQGPDRELDAEICRSLGFEVMRGYPLGTDADWLFSSGDARGWQKVLNFSESIDAALTLVEPGLLFLVRAHNGKGNHDGEGKGKRAFANVYLPSDDGPLNPAWAATPAIALCLAALYARGAS